MITKSIIDLILHDISNTVMLITLNTYDDNIDILVKYIQKYKTQNHSLDHMLTNLLSISNILVSTKYSDHITYHIKSLVTQINTYKDIFLNTDIIQNEKIRMLIISILPNTNSIKFEDSKIILNTDNQKAINIIKNQWACFQYFNLSNPRYEFNNLIISYD